MALQTMQAVVQCCNQATSGLIITTKDALHTSVHTHTLELNWRRGTITIKSRGVLTEWQRCKDPPRMHGCMEMEKVYDTGTQYTQIFVLPRCPHVCTQHVTTQTNLV